MNLAVLVGVSKYRTSGSDLPACENDVKVVKSLLDLTGKFQGILELSGDISSVTLKGKLAHFVKQYSNTKIKRILE